VFEVFDEDAGLEVLLLIVLDYQELLLNLLTVEVPFLGHPFLEML